LTPLTISIENGETVKDICIFSLSGKLVRPINADQFKDKALVWDGTDQAGAPLAAGIYTVRFKVGDRTENKNIMLMR
jgi:hypothetical protein